MACDEWAHIVLMAALEHTDDTALLRKSVLPELLVRPKPHPTLVVLVAMASISSDVPEPLLQAWS